MALSRTQVKEWISDAGIAEDKIGGVIEKIFAGHSATVDALKEERDGYKATADKLDGVQKELDKALLSIKDGEGWKDKYAALEKKQTTANKRSALEAALRGAKANESVIGWMLDSTDFESIEIGEGGALKDEEAIIKRFRDKSPDLFGKEKIEAGKQPTPPQGGNNPDYDKMDDAEYYAAVLNKKG